jgi:hypothetical protein
VPPDVLPSTKFSLTNLLTGQKKKKDEDKRKDKKKKGEDKKKGKNTKMWMSG